MKSFLQKMLPGVFGKDAAPSPLPSPVPAPPAARPVVAPIVKQAVKVIGAKRPLISAKGDIVGFEFRIADEVCLRLQARNDHAAQSAHVAAALASARLTAQTGRVGFARMPVAWTLRVAVPPDLKGTWIGLQTGEERHLTTEQLNAYLATAHRLREAGARVGWERTLELEAEPDFVLLRQGETPMAELLGATKRWPPELQALPKIATDMGNIDDLELALHEGVQFACGALAPTGHAHEPAEALPVTPEIKRVGYILNLLVTGAETTQIVREIKSDVSLSYRLLRRLNSASFAQLNPVASIDQAVMLLGRNELYRWLSLVLMQFAGSRKASSALQEIALWRARLLELLATERKQDAPDQIFTLGLASMLGLILQMSQADVVATLNLPESARQALLDHDGPWLVYLQMAKQIEAHTVDTADSVAGEFGGPERVLELADEAWNWGAQNADRSEPAAAG